MGAEISISREQREFVEALVATGRYLSIEDAISEAITLLATAERIRNEVKVGIEQADRNEVHDHDTVFENLRAIVASQKNS